MRTDRVNQVKAELVVYACQTDLHPDEVIAALAAALSCYAKGMGSELKTVQEIVADSWQTATLRPNAPEGDR